VAGFPANATEAKQVNKAVHKKVVDFTATSCKMGGEGDPPPLQQITEPDHSVSGARHPTACNPEYRQLPSLSIGPEIQPKATMASYRRRLRRAMLT